MRTPALTLLVAAAATGCGSTSTPASPQPPGSVTGLMAVVASGETHKLYLPAPPVPEFNPDNSNNFLAKLAVVDAATPNGAIGAITYVDLGADARPWAVGADGLDVVVVDRENSKVYFVDAATDTLKGTATLPAGVGPIITSDGPTNSAGVAVDAAGRHAYVSVGPLPNTPVADLTAVAGVLEFDLDTRLLTHTFNLGSPENFALDAASGKLYAPFYLCDPTFPEGPGACTAFLHQPGDPPITDSLTVVDLATGDAFVFLDPAADPAYAPLGLQPDALALDHAIGMAALAVEVTATGGVIYAVDVGQLAYDQATLSCQLPTPPLAVPTPADQYTSISVDAVTHLVVVAQEQGDGVFFVDLAKAKDGIVSTKAAVVPNPTDEPVWENHGDAHGNTVGIVAGRPYAFLVNQRRTWVARIDLLGVAGTMDTSGPIEGHVAFFRVPPPP